ncbi:MAG: YraN family protein [Chloroflexi bacterium]|nr:YraN family protein [Chloroflexota bacterium]
MPPSPSPPPVPPGRDSRRRTGRLGEDAAAHYVEQAGWRIVARNYRCRYGEIDIVAMDGDTLVFLEVRTRSNTAFGLPEESLTAAKTAKMARCALAYVSEHTIGGDSAGRWRVDFIAIQMARGRVTHLEHFRHALQ